MPKPTAHVDRMDDKPNAYFAFINAGEDPDDFDSYTARGPYETPEDYGRQYLEDCIGSDVADWLERRGIPADLARCIQFNPREFVDDAARAGTLFEQWGDEVWVFERRCW